jgi:ADP-heptose:LPS heptosyltransferase
VRDILIIKLGALGDVVMATSLVRQILDHHRGDRVWLLTGEDYQSLFAGWQDLRVQAFPRRGIAATLRRLAFIRQCHAARIYDLQSSDHTTILCALSGVGEIVGNHPRYPYTHHPPVPYRGQVHIYQRMIEVLQAGGIDARPLPPQLPASPADRRVVTDWCEAMRLGDHSFVILHAGASPVHPEKCWPGFGELAVALQDRGLQVVWADARPMPSAFADPARHGGIDGRGRFTLPQWAVLGERARFAVTNDSGPMHVLAASGRPVFGLFGPTNWRRNHAVGQERHVISVAAEPFRPAPLSRLPARTVLARLQDAGLLG